MEKHRNHSIRFFDYETGIMDAPDAVITKQQSIPFPTIFNIRQNATFTGSTKEPFFTLSVDNQSALAEHALMIGVD